MSGLSTLTILTIAWAVVTAVFFVLLIIRNIVGMKEEDTLTLSLAEQKMAEEQKEIQNRLGTLRPYLRGFGFLSAALLVTIAGIWIFRAAKEFFET
jgi:hypothetical protein